MTGKKYFLIILIALFAFFPLIPYIKPPTFDKTMTRCIFCDIAQGKVPETKIYHDAPDFVIFEDIKPASKFHYLAVTKRHIKSIKELTKDDHELLIDMETSLKDILKTPDAIFGFHMPPFISMSHLHMHGIAPATEMGLVSRWMFKSGTWWFKSTEEAHRYIDEKA